MSILQRIADNERGKALVELVLIAPLLLGIALPSIDGVQFARTGHLLNAVAREAGRAGFSCAYLITPQIDIERCLTTNINNALPTALGGIASNAEITVSIWEYNAAGAIFRGQYRRGTLASRINAGQIETLHSYSPEKNRIMVIETRLPINPMTPFFASERYLPMIM